MTDNCRCFRRLLALVLSFLTVIPLWGQQSMLGAMPGKDEVIGNVSIGIGSASTREEFLSPRPYHGLSYTIGNDRLTNRGDDRLFQYGRSHYSALFSIMKNDLDVGSQWNAKIDLFYGWGHSVVSTALDDLMVGPAAMFSISGLWNQRNSNNPATCDGYLALGFMAANTYRFSIGSYPMALQATLFLPLAGMGYAPDYDQLYWIMYQNSQYGRTLHFIYPGNSPALYQDLSLSIPLGRDQVSLGVSYEYMSNKLGGLRTQLKHATCMVGLTHRFERKYYGR